MKDYLWVEKADVLAMHGTLLAAFGGSSGVRDEGLLESALARPQQLYHYGEPSLHELAAAYAYGIVRDHPFVDGNKRAAFVAAALFIEINDRTFTAPEEEVVERTLALAAAAIGEAEYADWLARHTSD